MLIQIQYTSHLEKVEFHQDVENSHSLIQRNKFHSVPFETEFVHFEKMMLNLLLRLELMTLVVVVVVGGV